MRQPNNSSPTATRALGLILALALTPGLAWALSTDRQQPIDLTADHKITKYQEGISIYTGNVRLDQGSLHVEAERMTFHTDDAGQVERMIAEGQPARFRQVTDDGLEVRGRGLEIEYRMSSSMLFIRDNGVLHYGEDVLESDRIRYNTETEILEAGEEERGDSRVHITIQPRAEEESQE